MAPCRNAGFDMWRGWESDRENGQIAEAKQQLRAAMLAYPAAIDVYLPRFIWLGQNDANTYQELAQFAQLEVASYKRKQP